MTYEEIMQRCLNRIPDDLDKREGSVIWDALAPAAMELEILYIEVNRLYNNCFADTADEDALIKLGRERGIERFKESKAIVLAKFDKPIKKGFVFTSKDGNAGFISIEDSTLNDNGLFYARLECVEFGSVGNIGSGKLEPKRYIEGLTRAEIERVEIPARDNESIEEFRERYFREVKKKNFGGNIEDYERWTMNIDGVGACLVIPVWKGGGTVKVVILGKNREKASNGLVSTVQTALDPVPNKGLGVGIAPIGHTVTVVSASERKIAVKLNIEYKSGFNAEKTKADLEKVVKGYFKQLILKWPKSKTVLRESHLISRLLELEYVLDVKNVSFDEKSTLELLQEEIPVLQNLVIEDA